MRARILLTLAALLGGCSVLAPPPPPAAANDAGSGIASLAATLVDTPYHFGGADEAGFDCSGLTLYVHERFGITIPRTAAEQQHGAQSVPLEQLRPGDLVFFRIRTRHVDHVGVYAGDGRFIHAPHAGVAVSSADLRTGYYARHLVGAGRFWSVAATPP